MEVGPQNHAPTALRPTKQPPVTSEQKVWCAHNRSGRFQEN
jgi:hypothetical protein